METDPVVYPKITIEGQLVEVKFRCYDASEFFKKIAAATKAGTPLTGIESSFTQLAAGVAHAGIETNADTLMKQFDFSRFGYVSAITEEAMSLAVAQIKKDNPKLAAAMEAVSAQTAKEVADAIKPTIN